MSEDYDGHDGGYCGYDGNSGLFIRHQPHDFTGEDAARINELLSAPHRQRLELEPSPVLTFAPGTLGA